MLVKTHAGLEKMVSKQELKLKDAELELQKLHLQTPAEELDSSLRPLNEISETVAGLPYSLWALPDCSWWLGWLVWLVRLWGTQNIRSLRLEIFRFTIRVSVGPSPKPPTRHVGACAPLYGPL